MKKTKVLHIIKSLGRGGAEMLLPETLKIHDKSRFEFHYIYFLPWKDQMVAAIEQAGGRVKCIEANNNISLIFKYRRIIAYCRQNKIDIIHCHLPWAGFVGRIIFRSISIPVLYSEHNMQERYHPVTKTINTLSFNFQTCGLGVSHEVTNSIKKNISPKIPVKTLLNGVNTEIFVRKDRGRIRRELGIPDNAMVIGNVAVFRFQKRLVEWLKVFSEIRKTNPEVYGIIVGAGPLEEEIQNQLKLLKLNDKVFLPGLKNDVKPYYEAMDIFMMSSSFEGLPIALLEAMSMECAIVSTDAGGIKEVVRNGKDGLICQVDSWEELPELCQSLLTDENQLKRFKKASRERVIQEFSLKRMVNELEEYYLQYCKTNEFIESSS